MNRGDSFGHHLFPQKRIFQIFHSSIQFEQWIPPPFGKRPLPFRYLPAPHRFPGLMKEWFSLNRKSVRH